MSLPIDSKVQDDLLFIIFQREVNSKNNTFGGKKRDVFRILYRKSHHKFISRLDNNSIIISKDNLF